MINRHGAILERNLMLKLVPPDFIEDALDQASDTLAKSIKNPKDEIKKLVLSFSNGGITLDMLETYLGRSSDEWGGEEIVELTGIYNALKDGQAKKEHYWPKKPAETDQAGDSPPSGVQAMKEKTAQKAAALKPVPEGRDNEADPALFT
jgi:hypothetical protein